MSPTLFLPLVLSILPLVALCRPAAMASDLPALLTAPQGLCTEGTKFGCKDGGGSQAGAVEQRREGAGIAGQWPQG